jgi:electron transport complex protein RnfD
MTSWPVTRNAEIDGLTSATPLGIIKEGLMNGKTVSQLIPDLPSSTDLFLGNVGGSLGEVSALMIILGGIFMRIRKVITWHIPVSVIGSAAILGGIFWLINPDIYIDPVYTVLSGGLMLGAIFMATDMVTSPMTPKGQIIFGIGIGVITVLIRFFGAYPEGISFAILIMNSLVPLINRYVKPRRFGEKVKS